MRKRAAIDISARMVVIIIIAIVFLILFVFLIKNIIDKASSRLSGEIDATAPAPNAIISSPEQSAVFLISDRITFDGSLSYDRFSKIDAYFWDIDGDFIIDRRENRFDDFYYEPGEYNLTLKVVNERGRIGAASQVVKVYTNNKKMEGLEQSAFLIRDNQVNRKNILRLISVTTWNDINGAHSLPFYVYHVKDPSASLTETQLTEIMEGFGKTHAYVFDDPLIPCCEFDWGTVTKVNDIDEVYFDFWELYEYVVLVDPASEGAALIASLFAAFYNSPIIFVDGSNLEGYKQAIINDDKIRQVYYIPSVDSEVHQFIVGEDRSWIAYPTEILRDPSRRVNRLIRLSSNVTIEP